MKKNLTSRTLIVIAKEKLAFRKMGALCDLEQRHGVDLGEGYKNNQACASFVDCISTEQLQHLLCSLANAKFFSVQADGSTDIANGVLKLMFIAYYKLHLSGSAYY